MHDAGETLAGKIEQLVLGWIAEGSLRPGGRIPSIRALARREGVSPSTVSLAYDRLVAAGHLEVRPRSGFRLRKPCPNAVQDARPDFFSYAFDYLWQLRSQITPVQCQLNVSSGQLPQEWTDHDYLRRCLKAVAGSLGQSLSRYGSPMGYPPLLHLLIRHLEELGIRALETQVLTTHGAMHALDMIVRYHLRPGQAVLVDDPGYYSLFGNLHMQGIKPVGVPRTVDGPDLSALDRLAVEHSPKLLFTQSTLQTPTGSNISTHVAYNLLHLAEKHGFLIVETDPYSDLTDNRHNRLAAMDQLKRVVYVGSFSKSISPSLRVGFLAASEELVRNLATMKILTQISSNLLAERFVHQALSGGGLRKHLEKLRARLTEAHHRTLHALEQRGFECFSQSMEGKFLWLRHPACPDSSLLAKAAAKRKIVLAPGKLFRPHMDPTPWFRVNVAFGGHPLLISFLEAFLGGKP